MWLGDQQNNVYLSPEEMTKFHAITDLAIGYKNFQDSPYRGEFDQKMHLTFGEVQSLLREIAALFRREAR